MPLGDDLTANAGRLYRVALRIAGDPHVAEDVAQDACLRALQKADGFDGRCRLSTRLHGLTVNRAVDRLRQDGRRGSDFDAGLAGFSAEDSDPSRIAEQRELSQLAAALVETRPDDCRTAFVLTQLDGSTYDEAAEIEAVPRGTVASRIAGAKARQLAALDATEAAERRSGRSPEPSR